MTLEQIEVQIVDLMTQAKKLQSKAMQYQRQGALVARQGEVAIRESVNKFFDEGLTLLGKSIMEARKIKESFVAETHRKTAQLKRKEANLNTSSEAQMKSASHQKTDSNFIKATKSAKSTKPFSEKGSAIKKMKAKTKKHDNSFSAHARAR